MSFLIMSRETAYERYPPDDKPWLLSSEKELDESEEEEERYVKEWLKKQPYPGVFSTFDAKIEWLRSIHKLYEEELEKTCYSTSAPGGDDVASKVLLDKAPDTIWLEVYVPLDELEGVSSDTVNAEKFAANVRTHGHTAYTGAQTWDAYKSWLLEQQEQKGGRQEKQQPQQQPDTTTATSSRQVTQKQAQEMKKLDARMKKEEEIARKKLVVPKVLIGSIECNKDDKTAKKLKEFGRKMGLSLYIDFVHQMNGTQVLEACYQWGIRKVVGENLYCASKQRANSACYAIQITLKNKAAAAASKPEVEFSEMLDEKEQESFAAYEPKTHVLVQREDAVKKLKEQQKMNNNGKKRKSSGSEEEDDEDDDDEEEDIPETAEYCRVLWLSYEWEHWNDIIIPHFLYGEGESKYMQRRLQKGNTDTGNLKSEMFEKYLYHIKKELKSYPSKLCALLALTDAISRDTCWMLDNEYMEDVVKLVSKDLAGYWRTVLLKKDDKTLGIEMPGSGSMISSSSSSSSATNEKNSSPIPDDGRDKDVSESRQALLFLLSIFAKRLEGADYYGKVKFNVKLGHSRQPKKNGGSNKKPKV